MKNIKKGFKVAIEYEIAQLSYLSLIRTNVNWYSRLYDEKPSDLDVMREIEYFKNQKNEFKILNINVVESYELE